MKNKLIRIAAVAVTALLLVAFMAEPSAAQCAMCKASSEANLKAGGGDPRGLNAGILYMLAMPYLLVLGIGLWWWNNRKKERLEAAELGEGDL
jgi:hypothetical protein